MPEKHEFCNFYPTFAKKRRWGFLSLCAKRRENAIRHFAQGQRIAQFSGSISVNSPNIEKIVYFYRRFSCFPINYPENRTFVLSSYCTNNTGNTENIKKIVQFDKLKKDIEKSTWAFYLRLGRQELDAVPRCGGSPWPSSPFEKGGRAASLNFFSLAAGQEGPTMAPPGVKA